MSHWQFGNFSLKFQCLFFWCYFMCTKNLLVYKDRTKWCSVFRCWIFWENKIRNINGFVQYRQPLGGTTICSGPLEAPPPHTNTNCRLHFNQFLLDITPFTFLPNKVSLINKSVFFLCFVYDMYTLIFIKYWSYCLNCLHHNVFVI